MPRKRIPRAVADAKAEQSKSKAASAGEKRKIEDGPKSQSRIRKRKKDGPPAEKSKSSDPGRLIDYLLSDACAKLAHPPVQPPKKGGKTYVDRPDKAEDQAAAAAAAKKEKKQDDNEPATGSDVLHYPQDPMTPFQNLICACILSKPLSHKLGLRTIQTLFNAPFSLRTAKALLDAPYEKRKEVMYAAHTQHREKTATQLGDVVQGLEAMFPPSSPHPNLDTLEGLRAKLEGMSGVEAQDVVRAELTKLKGVGPGVVGVFLRRVQGDWEEVWPYADDRCLGAARIFGLLGEEEDAETLGKLVGDGEEGRKKLVRVLDALIGLELEGRLQDARREAGA